jgi:hypothetical protein
MVLEISGRSLRYRPPFLILHPRGDQGQRYAVPITREEIEKRMDELARKYVETHDPEIPQEIYRLARELEKNEKQSES